MLEDTSLTCRDCKQGFVFTAGERQFFAERNFGPPVRCKGCRDARKASTAPKPAPQSPREQVVQRVAERYQAPRSEPQQRRGYDSRPQRYEDEQPQKFDRHASKRRKHRHDRDDDDYDGW